MNLEVMTKNMDIYLVMTLYYEHEHFHKVTHICETNVTMMNKVLNIAYILTFEFKIHTEIAKRESMEKKQQFCSISNMVFDVCSVFYIFLVRAFITKTSNVQKNEK